MAEGSWYNGYSWPERAEKLTAWKRLIAAHELAPASGPCLLCGDPDTPVELHSEDYSKPYRWTPPAEYALCRLCHRDKLHKRFWRHSAWQAYVAHIRRGGYARDLKDPTIKKELVACRTAIERGETFNLRTLRPYSRTVGEEWFANLRMDPETLRDRSARPRP